MSCQGPYLKDTGGWKTDCEGLIQNEHDYAVAAKEVSEYL